MSTVDDLNSLSSSSLLVSLDDNGSNDDSDALNSGGDERDDNNSGGGHDVHSSLHQRNNYGWKNVEHLLEENNSGRNGSGGSIPTDLIMAVPSLIAPPSASPRVRSRDSRSDVNNMQNKNRAQFDPSAFRHPKYSFKRKDSESGDYYQPPTKSPRDNNDDLMAIPSMIAPPTPSPGRRIRSDYGIPQQRVPPRPSPLPKHPNRRVRSSFMSPRDRLRRSTTAGKYKRTLPQNSSKSDDASSRSSNNTRRQQYSIIGQNAEAGSKDDLSVLSPNLKSYLDNSSPAKTASLSTTSNAFNETHVHYETNYQDTFSLEEGASADYYQSEFFPPLSPGDKTFFSHATEASGSPPKSLFGYWLSPQLNTKSRKYSTSDSEGDSSIGGSTLDGLSTLYSSMLPSDSGSPIRSNDDSIDQEEDFHPRQFHDLMMMSSPEKKLLTTTTDYSIDLLRRNPESPITPHDQVMFGHLHHNYFQHMEQNSTPSNNAVKEYYDEKFSDLPYKESSIIQDETVDEAEPDFQPPITSSYPSQQLQRTETTNRGSRSKYSSATIKKTKLKLAASSMRRRRPPSRDTDEFDTFSSDSNSIDPSSSGAVKNSATPGKRRWRFEELLESHDNEGDIFTDGDISDGSDRIEVSHNIVRLNSDGSEDGTEKDKFDHVITSGKRRWRFEALLATPDDVGSSRDSSVDEVGDNASHSDSNNSAQAQGSVNDVDDFVTPGKRRWKFEELLNESNTYTESPNFVGLDDDAAVRSESKHSSPNEVMDTKTGYRSSNTQGKRRWKFEELLLESNDDEDTSSVRLSSSSYLDLHDEIDYVPHSVVRMDDDLLHEIITAFQSRVRGAIVRHSFQRYHDAATIIQRCVRTHNHRRVQQWEDAMKDSIRIQEHLLSNSGKLLFNLEQRQNYLDYHSSIIDMLGSRISDVKTLRRCEQYQRFLNSVVRMQENIRARQSRKPLASLENKCVQESEDGTPKADVLAQIERYAKMHAGFVLLQARSRGMLCRKKYMRDDSVAEQIKRYSQTHAALVSLQALFRGALCRKRRNMMHSAAIRLQKHTRIMLQRKQYLRVLSGFTSIQARIRGILERKSSVILKSVVLVQSHLRAFIMRSRYNRKRSCIILLQKMFRRMQAVSLVKRLHFSSALIQSNARGFTTRMKYIKVRRGLVLFQALARGEYARNMAAVQMSALMNIQCNIRSWLQRRNYMRLRTAAIIVQSRLLTMKQQNVFQSTVAGTISIQSHVRGFLARKYLRDAVSQTIIIQQRWKSYQELRVESMLRSKASYANDLQEVYLAATTIQCAYRVQLCQRELLRRKEDAHHSAIVKEAMAATKIQSVIRMLICQRILSRLLQERRTEVMHDAVVVIQSFARSLICQRELASLKDAAIQADYAKREGAAIVLQSYFRSVVCGRQLSELKEKNEELLTGRMVAAITIQSRVRVLQCTKELMMMKARARKRELASTKLQSCWRSWACRRELLVASNSAVCIQRCYNRFRINKGMSSGERMKLFYANDLQEAYLAATTIQCAYRVQLCQRELLRKKKDAHLSVVLEEAMAATKIQSVIRMLICQRILSRLLQERRTEVMHDAVVVIQSFARSLICQRELASLKDAAIQADYAKREGAAIVLQSYFRSVVCGRQLSELKEKNEELLTGRMVAAITIQSRVRVLQCKKELMMMKARARKRELASTKLQSCWRSWACRRELLVASNSAACIQQSYNRFKINKGMSSGERMKLSYANDLQEAYMAATTIQCAYRVQMCQRELLRRKEDAHHSVAVEEAMAATKIQSVIRMWICQRILSRLLQKRRTEVKNDAVVVIQSFARSLICQRELASLKDAAIQADSTRRLSRLLQQMTGNDVSRIILFQALFRGHLVRMELRNALSNVLRIQKLWTCKSRPADISYSSYFKSLKAVQDRFRRYHSRRNSAAKKIQLSYLSRRMKRNLIKVHAAVSIIQRTVRGHRARCFVQRIRKIRNENAVVKIQSIVRAYQCRKELQVATTAATTIQRCYHHYKIAVCETKLNLKKAYVDALKRHHKDAEGISIQATNERNALEMNDEDTLVDVGYISPCTKDAAVSLIQSTWRSSRRHEALSEKRNEASVTIQSYIRSWQCRQELMKLRRSKAIELDRLSQEKAAVRIQALVRSLICQQLFSRLKEEALDTEMRLEEARCIAVTKIQSIVRAHRCRRALFIAVTNATTIQRCYRLHEVTIYKKIREGEKRAYVEMLERCQQEAVVVRIQSFVRLHQCRAKFAKLTEKRNAEIQVEETLSALVIIQSKVRSWLSRRELARLRSKVDEAEREIAVIKVQSYARSWISRQQLVRLRSKLVQVELSAKKQAAALMIQAWTRSLSCRKKLHQLREKALAAAKIQSVVRARSCRREVVMFNKAQWDEERNAMAIQIQAAARSWLCRRHRLFARLSATTIQSKWRSYICHDELLVRRKKLERRRLAINDAAAVTIQSAFRSWLCQRELDKMEEFEATSLRMSEVTSDAIRVTSTDHLSELKSVVLIQSIGRMFILKNKVDVANKAASLIQQAWRRFVVSLQRKILEVSELVVMSHCSHDNPFPDSMHKARALLPRDLKRLNRLRSITPRLPRRYECGVFIQEVMNSVAIVIQTYARRYLVVVRLERLHRAASVLQKFWRSCSYQQRLRYTAVIRIQAVARGKLAQMKVTSLLASTIILQRLCRNVISRRYRRLQDERMIVDEALQRAAIVLQCFFRICLAKKCIDKHRVENEDCERLRVGDDGLNRLSEYFGSLRFSNKQLEEAAKDQWIKERKRLAKEMRSQHYSAGIPQHVQGTSATLHMSTEAEVDSILHSIYQQAKAIVENSEPKQISSCVRTYVKNLLNARTRQRST